MVRVAPVAFFGAWFCANTGLPEREQKQMIHAARTGAIVAFIIALLVDSLASIMPLSHENVEYQLSMRLNVIALGASQLKGSRISTIACNPSLSYRPPVLMCPSI